MTAWPYLLVFNETLGTRTQVTEFLDGLPEVTYWYACVPNCVFFSATVGAKTISDQIKAKFGTDRGQRFLVTEAAADHQGWLPKQAWQVLNHPDNPRLPK